MALPSSVVLRDRAHVSELVGDAVTTAHIVEAIAAGEKQGAA